MACKSAFIMPGELSIQAGACCGLMKVAEPRGHVMNFHWSLQNFNLLQKTSHAMDDEPRVRRQRTDLLVGCATRPMSEPHWHPHGRLRKRKNRLKSIATSIDPDKKPYLLEQLLAIAQAIRNVLFFFTVSEGQRH
jgi:hypothetical protein